MGVGWGRGHRAGTLARAPASSSCCGFPLKLGAAAAEDGPGRAAPIALLRGRGLSEATERKPGLGGQDFLTRSCRAGLTPQGPTGRIGQRGLPCTPGRPLPCPSSLGPDCPSHSQGQHSGARGAPRLPGKLLQFQRQQRP